MKYSKKHGVFLLTALFLAIILCSTASAANTTNATTDVNYSIASLNDTNNVLDPIISGKVIESPSNSGLSGVSIRAETTGGSLLAETTTGTNGTYSLNFASSDKTFKITASKLSYISYTQNVNVSPNSADPNNLYGTANFTLYKLPAYSGNASSYVLNVGVLPQILLDLYAGKSSSWVNSTASPYASSADTPLEIKLLNGSLLSGLLDVNSTGDQGTVNGGILPSNLPALLKVLGLKIGLLNATATSGTHPPASSGGSSVASVDLNLLNLLPVLNLGLISSNSSVTPNSNISAVISSSGSGVADITLLGGLLQIKALHVDATASANGQPGGASADFKWSVADILLNGKSILSDLTAKLSVELPGILKISLGNPVKTIAADGTSASVSGDALDVELLGLLLGGVKLTIGHADAAAQFIADQKADLSLTKTVDNATPKYQQNVTFTLTAHNNGPANATNVTVTDKLPTGLKFVSTDGNYNSTTGVWAVGNLASGATAILHIVAQAIAANIQLTNTAVIGGNQTDSNSSNNQGSVNVTVGPASDLGINITVNNAHPKYLAYVIFTLTAHNYGPNDAAYVKVYNKLPAGLRYVSDDSNGKFNSTTGLWIVGPLAKDASAILHLTAQAMISNATVTDTANITDPDPANTTEFYDPNSDNDNANVTVDVGPAADLSVIKAVDNAKPNYLQNVTFTLTAHNNGPDAATGVTIYDTLPAGLRFISADGNYNSTTGAWTIGNLAKNSSAILHIVAQVMVSNTQLTNLAAITGYEADLNSTNDQNNSTVVVGPASDLSITKTASSSKINYLGKVTFTLKAHNNGPDNATGVVVTDKLPNGLKFVSATGNGTYDSTIGVWTIGSLANGADATLSIVAQGIAANAALTNVAVVNGTNYDQNSTNNQDNKTVTTGPASDLGITMAVNKPHPKYMEYVTFTLTATNAGPNAAPNVKVYVTLPNGLKFISTDGAYNATYNSTTGLWSVGPMAVGTTKTLHIVAQAMISNIVLTAKAYITDPPATASSNSDFFDPNSDNDNADATVDVGAGN
ncbi:MAG TPA: choice-of-anchor P family protein, partial [Methanobacterium sp.]|nr:choice-of-anchor P family protein [Methanobacterium sp.]